MSAQVALKVAEFSCTNRQMQRLALAPVILGARLG
jgi:hypothetical protein